MPIRVKFASVSSDQLLGIFEYKLKNNLMLKHLKVPDATIHSMNDASFNKTSTHVRSHLESHNSHIC